VIISIWDLFFNYDFVKDEPEEVPEKIFDEQLKKLFNQDLIREFEENFSSTKFKRLFQTANN
jgi:predicted nucleic acid-binding protein